MELITTYWAEIALAIITAAGTITALTESTKDDAAVDVLRRIFNAVVMGKNRKR